MSRNRLYFVSLLIVVIAAGLASRQWSNSLPAWVGAYAGDTLWAMALYLAIALVFPRSPAMRIGVATIVIGTLIETSQLFHPVWLDAIRANRLVALVLGRGFLWSDLVCYTIGAALMYAADWCALQRSVTERGGTALRDGRR